MRPNQPIDIEVTSEGQALLAAAEVVAYLRHCADYYGSGRMGGSAPMKLGAKDALSQVADQLETAYIDHAADELTDRWWRS